jgi:Leucine-rich repeat (LRR) protein
MIGAVKDFLAPKTFSIVAYICAIVYCLCGTVLTSVTVALRASENGTFSCFVDANSTATYKKQVDQACFKRYDQAYNSPLPLYGFVLLSTDFTVLVSVIYSLIVRDRVNDIESRHERQTDGKAVNRGRNKKTVYVFYSYFIHLVLRGLFSITFTVLQHTYFYPNGFDFKFSCNLPPTDHVTSNISTPKNASRNLNGTLVTCENATASGKWLSGIIMSVINIIVALIVIGEVIYLLPRLTILNRGLSDDSKFVIEYLLRKQFDGEIFGETLPLTCVDIYHAASCSIDVYKKQLWNRSRDPGIIYGPNANIDDLYIDVLIHTERARHKFSKEMKRHETYDVYMKVPSKSIRLKSIRDLFYPNEDTKGKFPRSILAIGRPGIGKTVLTEKILKYYSDKIVFFFKFRWFNKLTNISLKTFLRFGTGLSEENFESIYEEIAKDPQKAILIFDGLDEYHGDPISCLDQSRIIPNDPNSGTSAMNLFIKLVLGDLLKGATVVVTSRPTADDFYSRLNFDRNVEIIGFTSDKIEEYVSRFCDNNNTSDLKTKIWNHIKSSSELLNLCYIPVNCFIVCVTLSGCLSDPRNETGALPTTLTELYQTAIDHFEKHHHRNGDRNSTAHEVLKKLQRLAFLGMESGQLVFNQTLFDEEMKKSGLLNSLSNPIFPLRTQFCFIHLTIQEFLAARHVTETLAPVEIKKFISDHVKSGKWHLVLQFIAGLLGKKIKNFDREYKDCVLAFAERFKVTHGTIVVTYHEVFIMKCLREVDDEEITKEVCETTAINDVAELYINPASYHLSTSEWAAVTFVCKHMKKLENLTLLEFAADCLPEVLGLLRKRCLNKLEMRAEAHGAVADEIDQVFIALMELNCTLDHKHTKLTSLALGINNGHCPNLIHLDLGNNSIRDEGAMVLCDTLTKGLCKLNRLDINKCELTFRCIPTLVKALQDERCQLTDLSLGNNAIGDEGVGMLFEDALTKEHCKLTELNLSKCSLTDRCIPSLCKTLQDEHCKLTKLWLRSNNFTANGWKVLRDIKNYKSCKARGLQIEEPMDQGEYYSINNSKAVLFPLPSSFQKRPSIIANFSKHDWR